VATILESKSRERSSSDLTLAALMILKGCQHTHDQTPTGLGPEQVRIGRPDAGQTLMGGHIYLVRPEYLESILVLYYPRSPVM
jgi:hypothetical protein